jgi:polysaccharide pyruvyl transferase WcaK-like protein
MAARRAHSIVLQSETEELKAALERDKSNHAWIARYYGISLRRVDSLVAKFHVFSNAADWISFHKMNTDFTISSRIHGCIASLLAGKPAMLVQHDPRTMELAETMGVSAIPIEKARKSDRLFFRDRLLSRDYLRAHYNDWAFRAKAEQNLAALLNLYRTNGLKVVTQ